MILLKRVNRPAKLTPAREAKLTATYLAKGKAVWKQAGIPKALMKMGRGKCCYCECKLGEESKYLVVEHFENKSKYPHLVVDWENLMPSCKRCNGRKGDLDVEATPIIFPREERPSLHLNLTVYFPKIGDCMTFNSGKDESTKGSNAVTEIGLIEERVTSARDQRIAGLEREIRELWMIAMRVTDGTVRELELASFSEKLDACLKYCLPKQQYGGSCGSFLLENHVFQQVRGVAESFGLWTDEHIKITGHIQRNQFTCTIIDERKLPF
jgi:HNH endonuclease